MPDKKLTDSEIIKALELEVNKKSCIHEEYEEACGLWCKHYHKWCEDMSGKNKKNNCSAFKPTAPTKRAKATLDLINRLQADCENYKKIAEHQQSVTMGRGFDIRRLKEKIESLQAENKILQNFKAYFDFYYGSDIEILGIDENGDTTAFDEFYNCAIANAESIEHHIAHIIKTAKAEAYKEFAERLKKETYILNHCGIDNLLKELVGEDNE